MVQLLQIKETDIEYTYLNSEEPSDTWVKFSELPIEQGSSVILREAYKYMKRSWQDELCDINYREPFFISFESESFYDDCLSPEPKKKEKKLSKEVGIAEKKLVRLAFLKFMKHFKKDLKHCNGEAWQAIRNNWRGDT